jgi:hypothetical protein
VNRYILAIALASSVVSTTAPALSEPATAVAPADRYFGRMQMSILGVRNSLHDLTRLVDEHPQEAARAYEKAVLVEDALRDWAKKFPNDPWLPKFTYSLAGLYRKIDTEDSRVRWNDAIDWLVVSYPASEYALMGRL